MGFLPLFFACGSDERAEQGNGTVVEEERSLENFSAITVEGNYTIELEQGAPGLTIQTDDNLMPLIQTEVKRNTLRLSNTKNIKGSDGVTIRIRYPELEKLEVSGAAKITNTGTMQTGNLEIEVRGAAMVDLEMEVRKLELDLSGASSVNFQGTARQLQADLSGAGNLEAYELQVRDAVVNLSGIGSAEVYVTDNLQAKVSGVGGIRFKGEPRNIQRQVSGVGSIEPASAQ
ncbi:hypothetical protein D770_16090 [Flammeovirgaceae bacterium 311]|nr:hypothetical protein D770_16090 [Flammeovirgaceae bacterium 311]